MSKSSFKTCLSICFVGALWSASSAMAQCSAPSWQSIDLDTYPDAFAGCDEQEDGLIFGSEDVVNQYINDFGPPTPQEQTAEQSEISALQASPSPSLTKAGFVPADHKNSRPAYRELRSERYSGPGLVRVCLQRCNFGARTR